MQTSEKFLSYVNTEILRCPECHGTLTARPYGGYSCGSRVTKETPYYHGIERLPTLLPEPERSTRRHPDWGKVEKFVYEEPEFSKLGLTKDVVQCLLDDIAMGDWPNIIYHVQRVIEPLPCKLDGSGRLEEKSVFFATNFFQKFFEEYCKEVRKEALIDLLGMTSVGRYEAELQCMGDYPGNFVLPDEIIGELPDRGIFVEAGMGNGANLRKIAKMKNPEALIGFDNCYGMVEAAINNTDDSGNFFYAIADAQYLPIGDEKVDVLIMLNTLDRLQKPDLTMKGIGRILKDGSRVVIGNCMPLQYDVHIGDMLISYVPKESRFESPENAINSIEGVKIKILKELKGVVWHPKTITQGLENLACDLYVAEARK